MCKKEQLVNGQTIERDPETGRFTKSKLSPDRAAELQQKSAHSRKEKITMTHELLSEAGYNPLTAPAWIRTFANQAAKNHQAVRDWRRFIGARSEHEIAADAGLAKEPPQWGQACRLCGQVYGGALFKIAKLVEYE